MNILMVASEAIPYLRTGDVATVVTSLSLALRKQGHDVRIVIPRYRSLVTDSIQYPITDEFDVQIGDYLRKARLWRTDYKPAQLPVYLIENQFYFGRENPYGYHDDYERFIFFTRAVVEMLGNSEFQSEAWQPEVIHGHDWSTGLLPMSLRHTYKDRLNVDKIGLVYTLHNVSFPGQFSYRAVNVAGLSKLGIYESIGETPSRISFMARGILAADIVNTVSPRHAEEIQTAEYARDLAHALKVSNKTITGILNGLDYTVYNPAFDEIITRKFDRDTLDQRLVNKVALQKECGLTVDPEIPLLGMVGRLIADKGVGLLEEILPTLIQEGIQIVIVGVVGDYRYREVLTRLKSDYGQQIAPFFTSLDNPLSRKLIAGADIILVPSLREPCGLIQMIAMRYGAIPVVHCTGGLADTVAPWNSDAPRGVGKGFLFESPDSGSFLQAIHKALYLYHSDSAMWQELQRRNMVVEFSWANAAREYVDLYKTSLLENHNSQPLLAENLSTIQPDQGDLLVQAILEVSELAITTIDRKEYLQQVASNVRELLQGDAVLIWNWDEKDPHQLSPDGHSFEIDSQLPQQDFDSDLYRIFSMQESRIWQYVNRLGSEQLGFLDSELARQRKWAVQLTAPMSTHGAFLGRIDVFSHDLTREFSDQDINTLHAFASAVAVNLEKTRAIKEAENLLTADREMAKEQTVDKIAEVVLRHALSLTHANVGLLRLSDGRLCFLDNSNKFKIMTLDRAADFQPVSLSMDILTLIKGNTYDGASDEPDMLVQIRDESSQIGAELINGDGRSIGEIFVFKPQPVDFSHNDEVVLQSLALQAANVLQAAYAREQDDQSRVEQLRKLATSLVGGVDFNTLLERVVTTTAEALQAEAASLYLVEPGDVEKLAIHAAYGYHRPLLAEKASYLIGEGTTGWIAQVGKTFKADSLEDLHSKTPWKGKHKPLQEGEREPNVFLGIPLKISDRLNPMLETVIGVLKFEDRKPIQKAFTDQDVRLGEMMANVIATVIQNTRLSDIRLQELNTNLQTLSIAMVGGLEMSVLVQRIVDTIARVLSADASSLFLIDPGTQLIKVQAGTGYQKDLVAQGASYDLRGEGLTAWIAREGTLFKANSIEELHAHPYWAGKHTGVQKGREPNVFLGIPLKVIAIGGREQVIGVLKVEDIRPSQHHPEAYFTDQDQLLVEMMGNVITTVIQNTRLSNMRLQELSTNLQTLSAAIVGGLEMSVLVQRIVDTIAQVLGADASSLFLIDPGSQLIKVRAGTGYQKDLVAQGASYDLREEGMTSWIAREGTLFKANSIEELHAHPHWAGKHTGVQKGREPNVFLGIPLKVIAAGGREEVIGVLKVEDIRPSPRHPEPYFTDQDQLLVEMMGNVITTVIQNTRLSDIRLQELNTNLQTLSIAMVGGLEMSVLVQRIVDTIARVLSADASSLFLIDPRTQLIKVQAATGYQKDLVEQEASYDKEGKGLTAWIAREGKTVKANSTAELHRHPHWAGKHTSVQKGREPNVFLGIPLKVIAAGGREEVIGVLKVEDIRPSPRHPEPYFTDQDQLLVEMMGNVITAVIQNTRLSSNTLEAQLSQVFASILSSKPDMAAYELFHPFVSNQNDSVLNAISPVLLSRLPNKSQVSAEEYSEALRRESKALLGLDTNPKLFRSMAKHSKEDIASLWYNTLYQLHQDNNADRGKILDAALLEQTWRKAMNATRPPVNPERIHHAIHELTGAIVTALGGQAVLAHIDNQWIAYKMERMFSGSDIRLPETLPVLFFQGPQWQSQEGLESFRSILPVLQKEGLGNIIGVISFLSEVDAEQFASDLRLVLKPRAIDLITFTLKDLQLIVCARQPQHLLRSRLLQQISLLTVSPYKTTGPTPDNMFFGREEEVRVITDHAHLTNYAVIGGRRVGKSSLLYRLHRVTLPAAGVRTLYYDCSATPTHESFLTASTRDWQPREEQFSDLPITFGDLLQSPPTDKPLVLLLDEADKLIQPDSENGWHLFSALRVLGNSEQVKVVLGGENSLHTALQNSSSPLFNFVDEMPLGPLNESAVEELVISPMSQLEIELVDPQAIVKRIWDFTSGHPNVVQRLCHNLIERLNNRLIQYANGHGIRRISMADVDAVIEDPEFQEVDFLQTYWDRATPLEQIISLLMVQGDKTYHLQDILEMLRAHNLHPEPQPDVVKAALDRLVTLRSILKHNQTGYEFAVRAFPKVLMHTVTVEDLLLSLKTEYIKDPT